MTNILYLYFKNVCKIITFHNRATKKSNESCYLAQSPYYYTDLLSIVRFFE